MSKKSKFAFLAALIVVLLGLLAWYLHGRTIAVLDPAGPVAQQERQLIYFALALSLIVVIPVFGLTAWFSWRYREGNTKATYSPELDHSRLFETIWWLIPSTLILILSVVAWSSSHSLDPYKPLASTKPALTIQVVALDWKWLFIYPQQHIATVNFFEIPQQTPVNFEITADAPMNSFWIPQLGGQIYAMPGMSTQLNLMASRIGSFNGSSANISGAGFSGMTFVAKASQQADFDQWVRTQQHVPRSLTAASYARLAQPSQNNPVVSYTADDLGLYDTIINKYMAPGIELPGAGSAAASMPGMTMPEASTQ